MSKVNKDLLAILIEPVPRPVIHVIPVWWHMVCVFMQIMMEGKCLVYYIIFGDLGNSDI